jgi:hypothetical protein
VSLSSCQTALSLLYSRCWFRSDQQSYQHVVSQATPQAAAASGADRSSSSPPRDQRTSSHFSSLRCQSDGPPAGVRSSAAGAVPAADSAISPHSPARSCRLRQAAAGQVRPGRRRQHHATKEESHASRRKREVGNVSRSTRSPGSAEHRSTHDARSDVQGHGQDLGYSTTWNGRSTLPEMVFGRTSSTVSSLRANAEDKPRSGHPPPRDRSRKPTPRKR